MRYLLGMLVLAGCGAPPMKANPCATKGATYFNHYVEADNGTCGAIPDAITNVEQDGTIAGDPPVCDSSTMDGCTVRNTNCKTTTKGVECSLTSSMTFASDGATANGLATIRCSSSATSCASTYQVTMLRQ